MFNSFTVFIVVTVSVATPFIASADEPSAAPKTIETSAESESMLFRRFLHSMSLTPLKKKPITASTNAADPPNPLAKKPDVSPETQATPSVCATCGVTMKNGKCSGGKGPCNGESGSGGGSGGATDTAAWKRGNVPVSSKSPGLPGKTNSIGRDGGKLGYAPNSSAPTGKAPNGNTGSQGSQSTQGMLPSGNSNSSAIASANPSASSPPASSGSSQRNSGALNSAQPGQSNVYGTGTTSGVQVPHVALGWEIVRPAGAGPTDWLPAISTSVSAADDNGDADSGNRLELGVLRSSLQTGPKNLLILPPDVASVVYVLDCSSSMTGKRFAKVQSAIVDAVSQMNAKQMFALLLFNTEALQICGGGYRNAGAAGAAVLAQELTMIAPSGGTNPSNALLLAIQLKPDAVVILSDGEFETSIVERVTQLNRRGGKNTQINCVAIGSQVVTLQKLATLNGPGNYVEVP